MIDAATEKPDIPGAAHYWAAKGFPVFPLRKHLKTPATGDGFKSATTDPAKLAELFHAGTECNIGIATGNGLLVIDIDRKNGVDGLEAIRELESLHGSLPGTMTVTTPTGGLHKIYRYEPALDIRSSAGRLGAGVDIRANGGYVVAAPSRLDASADPTGKTVTGSYVITDKSKIADLPENWVSLMTIKKEAPTTRPAPHYQADDSQLADLQDALNHINAQPHDDWVKVGMALYGLGDVGLTLWDTWSRNADNYDQAEIPKRWRSFAGTAVDVKTIFFLAQQNGWSNPAKRKPPARNEPSLQTQQAGQGGQGEQGGQYQAQAGYYSQDPLLDHVKLVNGLSITPRALSWVWEGFLPKGKLTLLVGMPKTGKTMLAIDHAATISSGKNFPDGTRADKASVVFWTTEDDLDDTIVPRFKAAGGDLGNIHFIHSTVMGKRSQAFNPVLDMPLLMDAIGRMEKTPALLVVDPVVSVTKDMNNALEVRMALAPLVEMAQKHGMAVLGITHFRKSAGESGNLGERIIGSSAFLQVARMVWYAVKPPESERQRLFFKGDTNLAESDDGFIYELEGRTADFPDHDVKVETVGVLWGERVSGDELQAFIKPDTAQDSAPAQVVAETFLLDFLASGEKLKTEIDEQAEKRGISGSAIRRAKQKLKVGSRKQFGNGKSVWFLPQPDQQLDQVHTPEKVEQVGQVEQVSSEMELIEV